MAILPCKEPKNTETNRKCPNCGADLKEEGIKWVEESKMRYKVYLERGEIRFEQDEFFNSDESIFYCGKCGADLPFSIEKVRRILR